MKNRTLQGVDSYPTRLAGIKGEQLRSRPFRSEGRRTRIREKQFKNQADREDSEDNEGLVLKKEFNV
jgi:hypothetical protein